MDNRMKDSQYKAWKKVIMIIYKRLAKHAWAFFEAPTESEAPGYKRVVKRAMDFTTIKQRIKRWVIKTTVEFQRDVLLMAQNAMNFHKQKSTLFNMAEKMLEGMIGQMQIMVEALGDGVPLCSGTKRKYMLRRRRASSETDESGAVKRKKTKSDSSEKQLNAQRKSSSRPDPTPIKPKEQDASSSERNTDG